MMVQFGPMVMSSERETREGLQFSYNETYLLPAMAMAALAACTPSTSALLHRYHGRAASPRSHGDAALAFRSSRVGGIVSLTAWHTSSCQCRRMPRVLARAAASDGGMRDGAHVEDVVILGLPSCLEVAEDGSQYLHVMASSMHNVDNGELSPFWFISEL